MYVYIDESGILTKGQGDFFIVATYVTSDKFAAERCIKNIRQNYLKKQYKECTELKYYNSSPEIVTRVLKCIVKQEIDAYYISVRKPISGSNQIEIKGIIFNTLIAQLHATFAGNLTITIDKFLKQKQQEYFSMLLPAVREGDSLAYVDSQASAGIQIVDFIAGTLSDIYNNPDDTHAKEYADILGKTLTECYFKTSYK